MAFSDKARVLWADAKRHPVLVVVGAVVLGFVIFYFYNRAKTTSTGTPNDHASPGGYTIVNEYYQAAPQGTKPPHPVPHKNPGDHDDGSPPPPPPNPNPNPGDNDNPGPNPNPNPSGQLIPHGQWPSGIPWQFGKTITLSGVTYTIGPGSQGRVWGVPGVGWSLQNWNKVPLSSQGGQKVLLYQ